MGMILCIWLQIVLTCALADVSTFGGSDSPEESSHPDNEASDNNGQNRLLRASYQQSNIALKVINGNEPVRHSWPWAVHIISGTILCGGSLISPQWILTAAHCLTPGARTVVTIGAHNRWGPGELGIGLSAMKTYPHEAYNAETLINDIALVKLQNPVTFSNKVRPIQLPKAGELLQVESQCYVAGWGRTSGFGSLEIYPNALMEASIPVVTGRFCKAIFPVKFNFNTMICAGGRGTATCLGDSGSGLVSMSTGNRWVIHGITSFGERCSITDPAAYTRVAYYIDWILNNTLFATA